MKILIIDDSALQRKLISQIIRKAGFENEILEAGDGQEGIKLLGTNFSEIGLILCDWNMPNMTGVQFLEGVAKVPQVARIPFFMVTSEGTEGRIKEAYEKHPLLTGYIVKPFTPDQLREKIEPVLKK